MWVQRLVGGRREAVDGRTNLPELPAGSMRAIIHHMSEKPGDGNQVMMIIIKRKFEELIMDELKVESIDR
jgi:hypothetical protein